jgi:hypothetical protein
MMGDGMVRQQEEESWGLHPLGSASPDRQAAGEDGWAACKAGHDAWNAVIKRVTSGRAEREGWIHAVT